jgi:hypothetical protein
LTDDTLSKAPQYISSSSSSSSSSSRIAYVAKSRGRVCPRFYFPNCLNYLNLICHWKGLFCMLAGRCT